MVVQGVSDIIGGLLRYQLSDISVAESGRASQHSSSQNNHGEDDDGSSAAGADGSVNAVAEQPGYDESAGGADRNTNEAKEQAQPTFLDENN